MITYLLLKDQYQERTSYAAKSNALYVGLLLDAAYVVPLVKHLI